MELPSEDEVAINEIIFQALIKFKIDTTKSQSKIGTWLFMVVITKWSVWRKYGLKEIWQ